MNDIDPLTGVGGASGWDMLTDIIRRAVELEREECATVALEQRCERGAPWDQACTAIAAAIRARSAPSNLGQARSTAAAPSPQDASGPKED